LIWINAGGVGPIDIAHGSFQGEAIWMIKTILRIGWSSRARCGAAACAPHMEFYHVRVDPGKAMKHTLHADFARGRGVRNVLDRLGKESEIRSAAAAHHVQEFRRGKATYRLRRPRAAVTR